MTYLIILLDDTSVSFCGCVNNRNNRRLIPLDILRKGIIWGMKENLNIQFVYPDYPLPKEYRELVETIDHAKIGPLECGENLDFAVVDNLKVTNDLPINAYIWQCSLEDMNQERETIKEALGYVFRLNVMLTDIYVWKQQEFSTYKMILEDLADEIFKLYQIGKNVQLNLLTDRLMLETMNNCGAGDTSISLGPDGKFYVCPAAYPSKCVGSLDDGMTIPNKHLYQIDHAPICRECDAFQCQRCIWLNEKMTGDSNTPSHQQCVAAHLERNASRKLQQKLIERGIKFKHNSEIKEIDYLDPFIIVNRWK